MDSKPYPSVGFYLSCFRPKYLTPDLEIPGLWALDLEQLRRWGTIGVVIDADNTLTDYNGTSLDPRVDGKLEELRHGFRACILSNSTLERGHFGVPVIQTNFRKPLPEAFESALGYMGTLPEESVVIGDRLLTDVAGAKRLRMRAVRVAPLNISSEPFKDRVVRAVENFALDFYRH